MWILENIVRKTILRLWTIKTKPSALHSKYKRICNQRIFDLRMHTKKTIGDFLSSVSHDVIVWDDNTISEWTNNEIITMQLWKLRGISQGCFSLLSRRLVSLHNLFQFSIKIYHRNEHWEESVIGKENL